MRTAKRASGENIAQEAQEIVAPILDGASSQLIQLPHELDSDRQIARDTGRWAATQLVCEGNSAAVTQTANDIAANSTLFGYTAGLWADGGSAATNKVAVSWPRDAGQPCPPISNQDEAWVQITIDHQTPVFFPFLPGDGRISTTAEFRMEPEPT